MKVRLKINHSLEEVLKTTRREIKSLLKEVSLFLYTDVVRNFLSGQALKVRSGTLRRSVYPIYEERGNKVFSGVAFGVKYAKTHIGRKGTYEIIKPKRTKFLAIPMGEALTPAGVSRYRSPRDVPNTFVKGEVIFQRRGKRAVPMFILKRQVKVPKRLDPEEILGRGITYLKEKLK